MFNMLGFVLNNSYIHPNTIMERYDFIYFHPLVGLFFLNIHVQFSYYIQQHKLLFSSSFIIIFSILFLLNSTLYQNDGKKIK